MPSSAPNRIVKVNDVVNVDEGHGLVFGFGIVCTKDGEDYYDLNVDVDGIHKGKPVPENVTEEAMFKSAVEAAELGVQMAGNDMHAGADTGLYYFMFPLTTEIAKAMEITTTRTGLMVAYKPEPAILAKFIDGTYTGFSIEGARVEYEEVEA